MEMGGESIGIGMQVGEKPMVNSYTTKSLVLKFPFTRKLVITAPSEAFVVFPGGLGTMHQLFEVLTLIQTKKMKKIPVILYDHAYWEPLHKYIKEIFVHNFETVSDEDDELYQIVDDVESIVTIINDAHNAL
jgi:uncharacterized protein (TIGR00730 family)